MFSIIHPLVQVIIISLFLEKSIKIVFLNKFVESKVIFTVLINDNFSRFFWYYMHNEKEINT